MSNNVFAEFVILICIIFYIINRKKIKSYLGRHYYYYYAWVLMLVSNLGYISSIQYLTRAGAIFSVGLLSLLIIEE